jgi:hypothetical protein
VYQFDESSLTLRVGVCTNPKRQRGAFIKLIHCQPPMLLIAGRRAVLVGAGEPVGLWARWPTRRAAWPTRSNEKKSWVLAGSFGLDYSQWRAAARAERRAPDHGFGQNP